VIESPNVTISPDYMDARNRSSGSKRSLAAIWAKRQ